MQRAEEMSRGQIVEWYFALADRWPDVFPDGQLAEYWKWARQIGGYRAEDHQTRFVPYLRAGALKLLRTSVGGCKTCPLHTHRLPGRPVLDDSSYWNDPFAALDGKQMPLGATSAKIMMVAEGPGQFEQRTGNPFVTYQVLAGSTCSYQCGEYENCYNPQSQVPQQPCKPTALIKIQSLDEATETRKRRAETSPFPIMTVAGFLDNALHKASLWREGWNTRQAVLGADTDKGRPRPGSIYLTNMVKCRSCKPRTSGTGYEDETPSRENMEACTPWLEMQIHIIQPQVVVAMGNPAIFGTTGIPDPKVISMRGNIYPGKLGLPVIAEVHPSFISRQEPQGQVEFSAHFVQSLEKAKQIVDGTLIVPWMKKSILVAEDMDFPSPDDIEFVSTFGNEQ